MRSTRGFAAAIAALVTYPLAVATGVAIGGTAADTVVHFTVGMAFVLLALAVFDFGLARWVSWLGATAAAIFGGTFILQGIADVSHVEGLSYIAFDVLGHQLERVLPDVVYVWFAALLFVGSTGGTRYIGWLVLPIVIGLEVAIGIGLLVGIDVPFIKLTIFLPFVWLLFESAKSGTSGASVTGARLPGRALTPSS